MNFLSLAVHPLIFPSQHKTSLTQASPAKRVSPSPLSQRQGVTILDNTGRAFPDQTKGYSSIASFLETHLTNHLRIFLQSGHALPTGDQLLTLQRSFERQYAAFAHLIGSLSPNINVKASPAKLIVLDKYMTRGELNDGIERRAELYTTLLKEEVSKGKPEESIAVIKLGREVLRDSHINEEGTYQWGLLHLFSNPYSINAQDKERFKNFVKRFSQEVLNEIRRAERDESEIFRYFFNIVCAPHEGEYGERISRKFLPETPLLSTWYSRGNRQALPTFQTASGKRHIDAPVSNWILHAFENSQPNSSSDPATTANGIRNLEELVAQLSQTS